MLSSSFSSLLTLCILTFVYLSIYFAYQIIASYTSIRSHQVFIDGSSSHVFSSFPFVLAAFSKYLLSATKNIVLFCTFCSFDFSQFWWSLFSIRFEEKKRCCSHFANEKKWEKLGGILSPKMNENERKKNKAPSKSK